MKTRGSWVRVAKFVGVIGLVCGLLIMAAFRSVGKRAPQTGVGVSQVAASKESKISTPKVDAKWSEAYGKLPLSFEENQGQTAREVRYVSHGSGYELFLTPQEAVLALRPKTSHDLSPLHRTATLRALRKARGASTGQLTAVRLRLEGANPNAQIKGMDQLPGKSNYFVGNDPKKWHTDVPAYARVKYAGVYPGVDLVFYGNQRRLEYDFIVAPGADPQSIALKVDGARKMRVNSRGDLELSVAGGEVELQKPVVYQNVNGERREIAGRYALVGNGRVSFAVDSYDRREPLILDPILNYSTYLGGGGGALISDAGSAIAVDASGNAFIAGQTFSTTFPVGAKGDGIAAPAANSGASFVAELNPAGTQLLYSAYLIGTSTSSGDTAFGIALDPSGKVYVTGSTFAVDFPTTTANALNPGPLATNPNGTVYLTKLDPTVNGSTSLLYSTYLAGTGGDFGNSVAADATGNAYVVGLTDSADYPTMHAFLGAPSNAFGNAFITRIDTTQSKNNSLIYSTYLGGNGANATNLLSLGYGDQAWGVAADSSKNAYVVGGTTSTDSSFIITGTAYQTAPPALNVNGSAFFSKIDTTQNGVGSLIYSTYLAGSTGDHANAIALGPSSVAYITGTTDSTDFPFPGATTGAFDTTGSTAGTAFVTLVDTTKAGSQSVTYSTYLGGAGGNTGFGIRVDASGIAYAVGTGTSENLVVAGTLKRLGAFQPTLPNPKGSPFIAKLNPSGNGSADLLYATYFGGTGNGNDTDQGFGIAIDSSNPANAYVTGQTFSTDMPVVSSLPTGGSLIPPSAAFVAKLTLIPTLAVVPTSLNFGTVVIPNTSAAQSVTLTNNTNAAIAFTSATFTGANAADFAVSANTCGASIAAGASCTVSVTFKPTVVGPPAETATLVLTDGDVNSPQNVSLSGTGTNAPPDFGLTGPTAVQNVTLGQTLTFNVTVTGTGGFNSPVALACTGAPALAVCTVTSPVTPPVAPPSTIQAQVSMTTTALVVPPTRIPPPTAPPLLVVPLVLALMLLLSLQWIRRPRLRLAMASAVLTLIALAGCNGVKHQHTPKGPATLTITGTSGALTHNVQVQISVN